MKTLRGADGLRAIACLMVIFHHLSQTLNLDALAPELRGLFLFLLTGSSGVSVFFVLSGFLLSMPFWSAYHDGQPRPDLRIYAVRRAGRIVPGFYVNLLFCFVLGLFWYPDAPSLIWRYLSGLTFTTSFHWLTFFPSEMNGPLWSIGFEVVSYVLMPVGMVLLFRWHGEQRSARKALLFWVKLWVVAYVANEAVLTFVHLDRHGLGWQYGVVGGAKFWMPRYNPLGFFGHFALGTLAAGLASTWSLRGWSPRQRLGFDAAALVVFALWLALLASRAGQNEFSFTLQDQPYYYPAFAALTGLLLACLTQSRWLGHGFDNPVFRYLARVSFGLYLWHYLVIAALVAWFHVGSYASIDDLGVWLAFSAATLVASAVIATASWYGFEQPLLRRAQAWRPSSTPRAFPLKTVLALVVVFLVLPVTVASVVRPSAWGFPKPWFVPAGDKLVIASGRGDLAVRLTGPRSSQGTYRLTLFRGGLFDDQYRIASQNVDAATARVVFANVPWAEYAVLGYHDENNNDTLDMNGYLPAEAIVESGTPGLQPEWDDLKFVFNQPSTELTVSEYTLQ